MYHKLHVIGDNLSFIVPYPLISLTLDKLQYNVGDTAIFTCTAEVNSSIAMNINEDIIVTMEVNGISLNTPIKEQNSLQYSSTHTVAITDATVAIQYTCTVTITSTSQYIMANTNMALIDLIVRGKIYYAQ